MYSNWTLEKHVTSKVVSLQQPLTWPKEFVRSFANRQTENLKMDIRLKQKIILLPPLSRC